MFKSKTNSKIKSRYPALSRLKGLMREYNITVTDLAKFIGRAVSTVSKSNNGHNLYDSMDMINIQKTINSKAKEKFNKDSSENKKLQVYTIDEIFYS